MYRFLLTRRWLVRTIAGLLLVVACVRLGVWQLDRNEERSERNAVIEANADAPAVPADELLSPDATFDEADQWRRVEVRGRYDTDRQLLLRLRPLDGERGVHVLTPLVTPSGAALLVDRGFFPSNETAPDVPPPPSGEVEVTARLRVSEDSGDDGDVGGNLDEDLLRAVDTGELAAETGLFPYQLYPAWAEAIDPVDEGLRPLSPPEVEAGPHLSYAFQWFIFATVGVVGYVVLVRGQARARDDDQDDEDSRHDDGDHNDGQRGASAPDSEAPDDEGRAATAGRGTVPTR